MDGKFLDKFEAPQGGIFLPENILGRIDRKADRNSVKKLEASIKRKGVGSRRLGVIDYARIRGK